MSKQQRSEQTRARILEAAQSCFTENGYDATGVAEICRRAGVSKGAFYHHFPSKQTLFLALFDRWLEELDEQMISSRTRTVGVQEALETLAALADRVFLDARGQLPMFLEFWTKAARDPAVWQATIAPYHRYRDLFAGMISAGIAEGVLRPVDAQTAARVLLAQAMGLLLQGLLDPDGANWGEVAQESMRIFLHGVVRKGE